MTKEGESPELSAQVDMNTTPNEEAVKKRKLPESATRDHSKRGLPLEKKVRIIIIIFGSDYFYWWSLAG